MKTLIAYHSRSGNTRRVAQALARRLGADLQEIRIVQPMAGKLGYALCALEAVSGLTPALRATRKDPAAYDLVIVGTPVWIWSLSSPVRSWLAQQSLGRARLAFFCTMGGSGARRVFATMAELAGRPPEATLALFDRRVDRSEQEIDAFVRSLQRGPQRLATRAHRPARAAQVTG